MELGQGRNTTKQQQQQQRKGGAKRQSNNKKKKKKKKKGGGGGEEEGIPKLKINRKDRKRRYAAELHARQRSAKLLTKQTWKSRTGHGGRVDGGDFHFPQEHDAFRNKLREKINFNGMSFKNPSSVFFLRLDLFLFCLVLFSYYYFVVFFRRWVGGESFCFCLSAFVHEPPLFFVRVGWGVDSQMNVSDSIFVCCCSRKWRWTCFNSSLVCDCF